MGVLLLVSVASLAASPKDAFADRGSDAVRTYAAEYTATRLARAHAAIPAWARRYNMNCSGCHYPAIPRLNATGQRFKWAGYRMPDEIGENTTVEKIPNYVAGHGVTQFQWTKTEGQPANNVFSVPEAGLFFAGPFARAFSGFLEFERAPDGTVDLKASVAGLWGQQHAYGGFRLGQMHAINEWGVAGFDRHVSVNDIAPISSGVTAAIPFVFDMAVGIEGYYVTGSNRLSAQVTNGIDRTGGVAPGGPGPAKDIVVIDQLLYDAAGSGIEGVAYYGTLKGVDTLAPNLNSHFWRFALTANKFYHDVEVLGGVIYGRDYDLPATRGFTSNEDKGVGWWVSGQYYIASTPLVLFGRYESVRPNTAVSDNTVNYVDLGTVLPINLPEYLKATLDYRLTTPSVGAKTNSVIAELQLNF